MIFCSRCFLETPTDDPCSDNQPRLIKDLPKGEILSPNYPEQYPNNADCQWHVKVEDGFIISLTFPELDLEQRQNNDHFYL